SAIWLRAELWVQRNSTRRVAPDGEGIGGWWRASVTPTSREAQARAPGAQVGHEVREPDERLGVERVVDPSSLATVGDEARVLEGLQVERQPGLGRAEGV